MWEVLGLAGEFVDLMGVTLDRDAYVVRLMGGSHTSVSSEESAMMAWIAS
jgi:hypothetical protein